MGAVAIGASVAVARAMQVVPGATRYACHDAPRLTASTAAGGGAEADEWARRRFRVCGQDYWPSSLSIRAITSDGYVASPFRYLRTMSSVRPASRIAVSSSGDVGT